MPNKVLRILFLYNGLFLFAGSLLGPLYAIYVERLGGGILPVCYSTSLFLFSATFFTFAISRIGDRYKHKAILLAIGFIIRAFCWFMYIFVINLKQLMILQFALGIGEALSGPAFDSIFAEHLDRYKHVMDYSDWRVVANFLLVIGTTLGGIIVTLYGFKALFTIMSIFASLSAIGILLNDFIENR